MINPLLNQNILKKEVNYLNKDFRQFKENLINFIKTYYPTKFQDFNESNPAMIFVDLAAYVGDVLSFYLDYQFKENLLQYATERSNILDIAYFLGYKTKASTPAVTTLDVFQLVPAIFENGQYKPDMNYALVIQSGMLVGSTIEPNVIFRTTDILNFKIDEVDNPTEITVYQTDAQGNPEFFLLKKQVACSAGNIVEKEYTFGEPVPYQKIILEETNVIEILNVVDSDGNKWYEVNSLGDDLVYEYNLNNGEFDDNDQLYKPAYLLSIKRTARRFETRVLADGRTELRFGAGIDSEPDEIILPSPDIINNDLAYTLNLNFNLNPENFLITKSYGQAPSYTTLKIRYVVGGGSESNISANTLDKIIDITFLEDNTQLNFNLINYVKSSVAVNNPVPATGGRSEETNDEIRINALAHFNSQNRAVTAKDYLARVYSMPAKFGKIDKAYVTSEQILEELGNKRKLENSLEEYREKVNPFSVSIYCLGLDKNNHLTVLNNSIKRNLAIYLNDYRILSDRVYIRDGYIINIGVRFTVVKFANYNTREVILNCIQKIKEYFDISKWQFNQPIFLNDLKLELKNALGVQNVLELIIYNKYEKPEYSGYIYDIQSATKNDIIYPSLDPSIFELKYPEKDIEGRVISV